MKPVLMYLLSCVVIAIVGYTFCEMFPKNRKAIMINNWVVTNVRKKHWLRITLVILIAPIIACIALIMLVIWIFRDEICNVLDLDEVQPSAWVGNPALIIRNSIFIVLSEQENGVFPIIRPLSVNSLPIQPITYRGVNALRLCVDKRNTPVAQEEAEAFKLRMNASIERHLCAGTFPGVLRPSEDGISPLFHVLDVSDRGIYWDVFIVMGNYPTENHHGPTPQKPGMQDNDF